MQFDPDWIDDPNYAGLLSALPPEYLDDNEVKQMSSSNLDDVKIDN